MYIYFFFASLNLTIIYLHLNIIYYSKVKNVNFKLSCSFTCLAAYFFPFNDIRTVDNNIVTVYFGPLHLSISRTFTCCE